MYDFLDIGCSSGGSTAWAKKNIGPRGVSIDADQDKVTKANALGFNAIHADARELNFADGSFRVSLFFDMLEHLPDARIALDCIREAYRVSAECVIIRGPNFDNEEILRNIGLKRYYADWSGHSWHHKASDFKKIVSEIKPVSHIIFSHNPVVDCSDSEVIPLGAPINSGRYSMKSHGEKPSGPLPVKMFSRIVCFLFKKPLECQQDLFIKVMGGHIHSK